MKAAQRIVALILLCGPWAQASLVTFDLTTDPANHTWTLDAIVSQGDNGGLAAFSVGLEGISTGTSLAPIVSDPKGRSYGFTVFNNYAYGGYFEAFAGQNPMSSQQVFGIGQEKGSLGDISWDVPVELFEGTYTTGTPAFTGAASANVYDQWRQGWALGADTFLKGFVYPEPGDSNTQPNSKLNPNPDPNPDPGPNPDQPPIVPAPASVILGALGLGLVRLLRGGRKNR